jgi:glycosyltransferase involved in cell wall biosynthesis
MGTMSPTPPHLVSIIIANWNYGRFLHEAISSALAQDYAYTEVVVVDDGSTDNSREVIESFGHGITAIFKGNGGQASAWNTGFRASHGEIVIFLDADDVLRPTAAKKVAERFDLPDVAKVQWPLWHMDEDGHRLPGQHPPGPLPEGDLRNTILQFGPLSLTTSPGGGAAWHRFFLAQVFPLPEKQFRTGADTYLLYAAPLFGLVRTIPEAQAYYRRHGAGDSSGSMEAYVEKVIQWDFEACRLIADIARRKELQLGPNFWKRDTMFHRMKWILADLDANIPSQEIFIIADQGQMQPTDLLSGRRCLPFMERDGMWWGNPPDDEGAIRELERLRKTGANHFALTWLSFWYCDAYPRFAALLRTNFSCTFSNNRVMIFGLT